jgi:hypothetical protein
MMLLIAGGVLTSKIAVVTPPAAILYFSKPGPLVFDPVKALDNGLSMT